MDAFNSNNKMHVFVFNRRLELNGLKMPGLTYTVSAAFKLECVDLMASPSGDCKIKRVSLERFKLDAFELHICWPVVL